jgi:hypothetical protein
VLSRIAYGIGGKELDDRASIPGGVSRFSSVMASVLAIGLKVHGFKPGQCDGYLRAIKIRSTPSFTEEVKPEAPCRKLLWHVSITSHSFRPLLPLATR